MATNAQGTGPAAHRTDEELKEAFAVFANPDTPQTIDCKHLGTVLRALGRNPTNAEVDKLTSDYGGEEAKLEFAQLKSAMEQTKHTVLSLEDVVSAFRRFDEDGSGLISITELRKVLTTKGEMMSDEEVEEMIGCIEPDREGKIKYEDLAKMLIS